MRPSGGLSFDVDENERCECTRHALAAYGSGSGRLVRRSLRTGDHAASAGPGSGAFRGGCARAGRACRRAA